MNNDNQDVYLVEIAYDYYCSQIIGVYTTDTAARAAADAAKEGDEVTVTRYCLDQYYRWGSEDCTFRRRLERT